MARLPPSDLRVYRVRLPHLPGVYRAFYRGCPRVTLRLAPLSYPPSAAGPLCTQLQNTSGSLILGADLACPENDHPGCDMMPPQHQPI